MLIVEDEIEWNQDFVLTVDHFCGSVDMNASHDARSHTGVNYFFKNIMSENKKRYKVKIEDIWVKAYFFPSKSWLRPEISGEINLPKLLKHEQGHFDLAEKYARKFDRKLKNKFRNKSFVFNKNFTNDPVFETKTIIQNSFNELNEEVQKAHIDYDKETNHGLITVEQEKYDARFSALRNIR